MFKKLNPNSLALWAAILILTLGIAGFSASALLSGDTAATDNSNIISTLTNPNIAQSTADTTDELVYVITDKSGQATQILANSYAENKFNETSVITRTDLPVTFDLQFTLDGQTISAQDLSGRSGHVTITYNFENHQKYGNYQVPFATITTAVLGENFDNVTVTNGRILDDGTRKVVLGLTLPGLSNNFNGINLDLPTSIEISADVTDFKLESTYTIATNQVFSQLDTSSLSTIDDLSAAMDQLSSSLGQIIAGSTQLRDGLQQLLDKSGELTNGVNQLNDGLQTLSGHSSEINNGIDQVVSTLLDQVNTTLSAAAPLLSQLGITVPTITTSNYTTILDTISNKLHSTEVQAAIEQAIAAGYITRDQVTEVSTKLSQAKTQLTQLDQLVRGIKQYTAGVDQAAAGTKQLADNLPVLTSGVTALRDGAAQLTSGLQLFNQQGISRLVAAGDKATDFANDLRATVSASQSYTHYSQPQAKQVTFIYKTPTI